MTSGPSAALARIAGASPRQALASLALAAGMAAVAWRAGELAWLSLFAVFLLVSAFGAASLRLARAFPRPAAVQGWRWAWLALLAGLAAGAGAGTLVYQAAVDAAGVAGIGGGKVYGGALAFGAAVLALPLVYAQRQAQELHMAALKQAALSAELKSLQAQVEPHFLYNTLANTRYLARHDPDKAVRMLDHLIAYLRTALPDLRTPSSTLAREFQLAEHYLALMAIRFGDRLAFELACPPDLEGAAMPPLMLMSLVENAVRHGVEPKPGAVRVKLAAARDGARLRVLVCDDGAGLEGTVFGSGVGLRNVRERLAALYDGAGGFELRAAAGGGAEAELRLPLSFEAA
ncbi:sensor histidine kinase [Pseudoduganella namucuonensis]|uniref:Histidine kinase n=1 Tax=Pseudoduganella namucuonensis TaxID=1035707 RepID=A0A1I7H8X6_9BURK|nr:histidine kinase [Pseudoduganella namucuonensis]SFU57198.1 Histidine kinase [Pseudoduganella namucuonensis]